MKLWMKIFTFVFALFILSFDVGIFLMSSFSYNTSIETARNQAFTEHDFISSSLSEDLDAILKRDKKNDILPAITSLISYYSGYYKKQNIFIGLVSNETLIAGNLPQTKKFDLLKNPLNERTSIISSINKNKYIFVSGKILKDYVFIYSRNITPIVAAQEQLTKKLILTGIGLTLFFVIVLYFLIKTLMKPIKKLQNVTQRITAGEYNIRVDVKGNDEISTLATYFNEMTEEVLSQIEEHKKISQGKQQFIDNLSHELKTPLTAIYGYSDFLQKTKVSENDLIDATSNIMQNVNRIQTMSKKLLDLALTRDVIVDQKPIELNILFEKIQKDMHSRLIANNNQLLISCEVGSLYGDPILIENLIVNLLDNAIKASNENGKIFLSSTKHDTNIIIEICDEGIGIHETHLDYIFDPFYRTDFARANFKKYQDGAGLGLALCKQIVDAHKANIEFESKPKQGTKITITFTTSQQLNENSII